MKKRTWVSFIVLAVVLMLGMTACGKKKGESYRVIKVEEANGQIQVERAAQNETFDAFVGMQLVSKDKVVVAEGAELMLLMDSKKHMCAKSNTTFILNATGSEKSGDITIELLDGDALFEIEEKLNENSSFKVTTPNAVLSVRGTTFRVVYDSQTNETIVSVTEGIVRTEYNERKEVVDVEAGEAYSIKNEEIEAIDIEEVPEDDQANNQTGNQNVTGDPSIWNDNYANGAEEIAGTYQHIVENMTDYVAGIPQLTNNYYSYDYMYFDYNLDGINDVIFYLHYDGPNKETYLDLAFLWYNPESGRIEVYAVVTGENDDAQFYCEYEGLLCRYSWRTNPYESYLYSVRTNGNLCYVLEKALDYIVVEPADEGMTPLPLYLHAGANYTDISPFLE